MTQKCYCVVAFMNFVVIFYLNAKSKSHKNKEEPPPIFSFYLDIYTLKIVQNLFIYEFLVYILVRKTCC